MQLSSAAAATAEASATTIGGFKHSSSINLRDALASGDALSGPRVQLRRIKAGYDEAIVRGGMYGNHGYTQPFRFEGHQFDLGMHGNVTAEALIGGASTICADVDVAFRWPSAGQLDTDAEVLVRCALPCEAAAQAATSQLSSSERQVVQAAFPSSPLPAGSYQVRLQVASARDLVGPGSISLEIATSTGLASIENGWGSDVITVVPVVRGTAPLSMGGRMDAARGMRT